MSRRALPAPRSNRIRFMHLWSLAAGINWRWVWLVAATFIAGVLNAVAGGGSFLSFPAILSMRILPVQANATNTVAIWPGQLTSVAAYWPDVRKNPHAALLMGLAGYRLEGPGAHRGSVKQRVGE